MCPSEVGKQRIGGVQVICPDIKLVIGDYIVDDLWLTRWDGVEGNKAEKR
jgi:hypothetical protein